MAKRQNHGNNHGHNNHNQDHGNNHGGGHGNSHDTKKDDKKQGGNDKYTTVTFLKDSAWNSLQSLLEGSMGKLAAVLTGSAAGAHTTSHNATAGHSPLTDLANGPIATAVGKGAEFLAEKAGVSPQTAERVRELFEESAADLTKAIKDQAGANPSPEDITKILTKQFATKARLFKVEMKGATPILHLADCEDVPKAASRSLEEIKAAYSGKHVLLPKRCCGEFAKYEMKKLDEASAPKPAKPPFPKSLLSKLQWMRDYDAEVKAEAAKDGDNKFKKCLRWFVDIAYKAKSGDHHAEEQLHFLNSELKEADEIKIIILEEDNATREGLLKLAVENGKLNELHHLAAELLDLEKAAHELDAWSHEIGASHHSTDHTTSHSADANGVDKQHDVPPLPVHNSDIDRTVIVTPDVDHVTANAPQPPSLPTFELMKMLISDIKDDSVSFEFESNRESVAEIKYRENSTSERWKPFSYETRSVLHTVTIDGLTKGKEYLFKIVVKDTFSQAAITPEKEISVKVAAPAAGATFRPEIIEVPKPKAPEPKKEDGWLARGWKGMRQSLKQLFS